LISAKDISDMLNDLGQKQMSEALENLSK